ncbi:MAG: Pycsar system effector family protein [Fimbriimonadaceae bacterium]
MNPNTTTTHDDGGNGTSKSMRDDLEDARQINNYLNHYITVTDAKALGIVAGAFASGAFLLKDVPQSCSWVVVVYYVGVLLHAATVWLGLSVIYPRVPTRGSSVVFWEDVQMRPSLRDYLKDFKAACENSFLDEEYASQNYLVSKVLHRKTALMRWAIRLFVPALALGLIAYGAILHKS